MGAKTSTANGANGTASSGPPHHQHHVHSQQHDPQSPRTRTFSSSSSSATEVLPPGASSTTTGFNLLRSIPGLHVTAANQSSIDRQRARSLSSVPDLQQSNGNGTAQSNYLNGKDKIQLILTVYLFLLHLCFRIVNKLNVHQSILLNFDFTVCFCCCCFFFFKRMNHL